DGSWKWFYDRGKVTRRSEEGKPLFLAGIVFDVTESKQYEKELEKENVKLQRDAGTDALTGIHNRRAVIEELERKLRVSQIQKRPLSVGMFDIDHFKDVNDTKGHVFGDTVLKGVADQLYATVREKDTVGRYGGEEFLVVFFDATSKEATAVADRIRKQVELYDFGKGFTVTVSGGIAEYSSQSLEELIDEADKRLYTAKQRGRNQIVS
ncbi:MAG: diguanylate cyclase, partial [Spirochaetota bacterium]